MTMQTLFNTICQGLIFVLTWAQILYAEDVKPFPPPGIYERSAIGNSFSGGSTTITDGAARFAQGRWVQDNIGAMAVAPDGTVFNVTFWEEGGHGLTLYKNGLPNNNRIVVRNNIPLRNHFTDATGVCVDGNSFYITSVGKALFRFTWIPGDIDSARYVDDVVLSEKATGLSCSNGKILIGYPDKIELRAEASMQLSATYPINDTGPLLLAPDGSFWLIAGENVHHLQANGEYTGVTLPGIGKPTSLGWSRNGELIVSDNGPAQQVLIFDVSGRPRLVSTFGVKGGLYSGIPGALAPQKLFSLRGVGMDAKGNLYVGMSFTGTPNGNAFIRAFSPTGKLLWEDYATAWVDTFGFQPGSDGTVVYGRSTRWQLNLDRHTPGSEATLTAITLDPLRYPDDPRIKIGYSVNPRLIHGTQLLYANSQYGNGFVIFAGSPGTLILHQVNKTPVGTEWASVTQNGDIWAIAQGKKIALYRLQSITDGQPVYDWQHPEAWPWPRDFKVVHRVIYDKETDSLYVFGFLNGQPYEGFDIILGLTARRYDGWLSGNPHTVWTNTSLPTTPGIWRFGTAWRSTPIPPKDVSLAGDYLFLGMVRDLQSGASIPRVNIISAKTGKFVGMMTAGPEVGLYGGWEDMVGSIQATKRKNGEYLVLVEDDAHARNLLFRWTP